MTMRLHRPAAVAVLTLVCVGSQVGSPATADEVFRSTVLSSDQAPAEAMLLDAVPTDDPAVTPVQWRRYRGWGGWYGYRPYYAYRPYAYRSYYRPYAYRPYYGYRYGYYPYYGYYRPYYGFGWWGYPYAYRGYYRYW
jgi:hypothetical protein